ncbi:site-2 protease family protein [Desulforamulus aeronauticus]|uniref:Zn-dependent protease (Includes SpoIVFB) n=1 Tax=Desulforamulus aeronauticus DSM 10349 TaxID=1121421 RepID=A0A1M6SUS3_9FIRM|nr:site-2 protease family protein [Desulforamulus aeronauticus]SHK48482.1 Zn-dependent protease (includes SpoIVFB) [Desulforamulus aeronauticus DSM 10349]
MFGIPSWEEILLKVLIIMLALPLHEYGHAMVAYKLGDNTAYQEGRLTLNPLKHLDPLGTLMIFFGPIGWAKPVPVNPFYFNNRKQGMMLVSLAGPLANLLLALLGAVLLGIFHTSPVVQYLLYYFMVINIYLAVFNLLPLPMLDGSKILAGILPGSQSWLYNLERYGFPILLLLVIFGLLTPVITFFANPVIQVFHAVAKFVSIL